MSKEAKNNWEEYIDYMIGDDIDEYSKEIIKLEMFKELLDDVKEFVSRYKNELGKQKTKEYGDVLKEIISDFKEITKLKISNVDLSKIHLPELKTEKEDKELVEEENEDFFENFKS